MGMQKRSKTWPRARYDGDAPEGRQCEVCRLLCVTVFNWAGSASKIAEMLEADPSFKAKLDQAIKNKLSRDAEDTL
eukprot:6557376-Alexandrium_andersonii.AAC.1